MQTAAKAWTALAGSLITAVLPWILQASSALPPPWPQIIGAISAILTAFGVYRIPNKPAPQPEGGGDTPWPQQ